MLANFLSLGYNRYVKNMPRWSSGQDVALSRLNRGFDSPTRYQLIRVSLSMDGLARSFFEIATEEQGVPHLFVAVICDNSLVTVEREGTLTRPS